MANEFKIHNDLVTDKLLYASGVLPIVPSGVLGQPGDEWAGVYTDYIKSDSYKTGELNGATGTFIGPSGVLTITNGIITNIS